MQEKREDRLLACVSFKRASSAFATSDFQRAIMISAFSGGTATLLAFVMYVLIS